MGRLGELEAKRSARNRKRSRKPRGQHDVVVDHQQPVGSSARMGGEQQVEVLELPELARAGARCSSTSWRERASSARIAPASCAAARALDAEHEHAAGGAASGARRAARRRRRPPSSSRASTQRGRAARGAVASRPPTVPLSPERKSSPCVRGRRRRCACASAPVRRRPCCEAPEAVGDHRRARRAAAARRRGRGSRRACAARARSEGAAPRRVEAARWRARGRGRRGRARAGARRRRRGDGRARRAAT